MQMANIGDLLMLAQRFRENAHATQMPLYIDRMLRAATDIEDLVRNSIAPLSPNQDPALDSATDHICPARGVIDPG